MDKSWMVGRSLIVASCLLVLAGCMSQPMMGSDGVPLTNTYWKLQEVAGEPTPDAGAASEAHLILRDDGVVNGFSGCNAFRGEYEVINNRNLVFSRMASTRRACLDIDIPEQAFFRALENTAGVQMDDHRLRLLDTDGQELAEFEAIGQP
ncbi:META domain-containing protein [Marinobacter sp. GN3S48]|uniref:META domain-containing protein n=1 Tax=Marinobacter sp. GN3S48 TaxID=3382302 RepID=UPI00387ACBD4